RAASLVLLAIIGSVATGGERTVSLRGPLSTPVTIASWELPDALAVIDLTLSVPDDAPRDLRVGAWVTDQEGHWFQSMHPETFGPGRHQVVLEVAAGASSRMSSAGHSAAWTPYRYALSQRLGLIFATAEETRARIAFTARPRAAANEATTRPRLLDLDLPAGAIETGRRWQLECVPAPFPSNPYDHERFRLLANIRTPGGSVHTIDGFFLQEMDLQPAGDHEAAIPRGQGRFAVRYRARLPGRHTIELVGIWNQGLADERRVTLALPPLQVTGAPWDDYVRVDARDPRFFGVGPGGERFYYPIGLNIRSVNDPRGARCTPIKRETPDLRSHSYAAYLARLAAAGGNATEIWMCSWNLALEWRDDWPHFHGIGRYHQPNAQRLDRILDQAYAHGVRVNLVIHNHGMGSERVDREWQNSPYNKRNGGPFRSATALFHRPFALAKQEQYRRYLIARYADHPAILGWKLWSEINLTAGGSHLREWHRHASERWHALDVYDHPVTTHWAGDFRSPDRTIVRLPQIDYVCIDAYHGRRRDRGKLLAQLLRDSTQHSGAGLARFGKPVLVTEYGGSSKACPEPQLIAEHRSGPWAAITSGHGGTPMLWWFEWVDQNERYGPYAAVARFLAGEDLRGQAKRSLPLTGRSSAGELWINAWFAPGDMLGYILARRWGYAGKADALHREATVRVGTQIAAGAMQVEWWDADSGRIRERDEIDHPGGELVLRPPPFRHHLAFKLRRRSVPAGE
ncbi:MAG: hypothetical protein ACOC02_05430, partial [Guyparkeria sp.]